MRFSDVLSRVTKELSGTSAKDYIANIAQYHRLQATPGFHEAVMYIKDELEKLGFSPKVHHFIADGKTMLFNAWRVPIGWEVIDGELRIVKPEEYVIGRFKDVPCLVVMHSGSKPEGVEAEIVDVGTGIFDEEYEKIDVRGKFVLASGRTDIVHEKAVIERGAIGVIGYHKNLEVPEAVQYRGLWVSAEEVDKVGLAFSISYKDALKIQDMLKRGKKVVAYAKVITRFFKGELEVLELTIEGKKDNYIMLTAHVCHPKYGAHDNASGAGLLLEIARVLSKLAKEREFEYGIKMLWVPEFFGTIAYVERFFNDVKKVKSVINLDMVGASQERTGSVITVIGVAPFCPTFLPWLAYYSLKLSMKPLEYYGGAKVLPPLKYTLVPYTNGSDHHVFIDPILSIPSTAYIEWPDKFYHTSHDTIENIDPRVLKVIGDAALSLTLYLCNFDKKSLVESLCICESVIREYLEFEVQKLMNKNEYDYAKLRFKYLSKWLSESIKSFNKLIDDELINKVSREIEEEVIKRSLIFDRLKEQGLLRASRIPRLDDNRVYRRSFTCPIEFREVLRKVKKDKREKYFRLRYFEKKSINVDILYYLFDGKKCLRDIFEEYYAWKGEVNVDFFKFVVECLEESGWIKEVSI